MAREKAERLRRDWKIARPYAILHPGSARPEKLGDAARWAEVIDHFREDNDFDFVLTSVPAAHEQTHIAAITHSVRQKCTDLSGKTVLLTLTALAAQAQL